MTIQDINNQRDKTPIDQVQGKVVAVYKPRDWKGKPITDMEIQDGGGNKIKVCVWEHTNMEFYKDKEIVISSGPRGGVQVKYDDYKKANAVSVGKAANFQVIEVGGGSPALAPTQAPQNESTSSKPAYTPDPKAEGSRNGMCFKLAGDFHIKVGTSELDFATKVKNLAKDLIAASKELDA